MKLERLTVTVGVPQLMRAIVEEIDLPMKPTQLWIADCYQTSDAEGNPLVLFELAVDQEEA